MYVSVGSEAMKRRAGHSFVTLHLSMNINHIVKLLILVCTLSTEKEKKREIRLFNIPKHVNISHVNAVGPDDRRNT